MDVTFSSTFASCTVNHVGCASQACIFILLDGKGTPIFFTVFPVKPRTPEKISGIFTVSRPIECKIKPLKVTAKLSQQIDTKQRAAVSFFSFTNTEIDLLSFYFSLCISK